MTCPSIVDAVTDYVARRMIEREHAHGGDADGRAGGGRKAAPPRRFWTFVLGFVVGALALFGLALFASLRDL